MTSGFQPMLHTDWTLTRDFACNAIGHDVRGIHLFYHPTFSRRFTPPTS